jgi:hypothetical protein
MAHQFIGALISLTSKSEVRYQGRLVSLNRCVPCSARRSCGSAGAGQQRC